VNQTGRGRDKSIISWIRPWGNGPMKEDNMLTSTAARARRIRARLRCKVAVLARLDARMFHFPASVPLSLAAKGR